VFAEAGSALKQATNPLTLINSPAFSQAFVRATRLSLIDATFWTFSGSATGPRYIADTNGVIFASQAFPGNSAGYTSSGGQYIGF
jgi:hypothetical protein